MCPRICLWLRLKTNYYSRHEHSESPDFCQHREIEKCHFFFKIRRFFRVKNLYHSDFFRIRLLRILYSVANSWKDVSTSASPFMGLRKPVFQKSVVDIATNIAVITYSGCFRGLLDVMKIFQLKINSELHNFSMEINQSRIKAANCSASKHRKSAWKDLTLLTKQKSKTHAWKDSYMMLG